MFLFSCPDCASQIGDATSACHKCGLQLSPELIQNAKSNDAIMQKIALCKIGGCFLFCFLIIAWASGGSTRGTNAQPRSQSIQRVVTQSPTQSSRDRAIERYTKQQVDRNWRSRPGGNSKAEAVRASSRIRKARTWDELEAAIQQNIRDGI